MQALSNNMWSRHATFQAVNNFLVLQNAVGTYFMTVKPRALFNTTIKPNVCAHIAANTEFQNPRLSIFYAGEDYMNHIRRMVSTSIQGLTKDK